MKKMKRILAVMVAVLGLAMSTTAIAATQSPTTVTPAKKTTITVKKTAALANASKDKTFSLGVTVKNGTSKTTYKASDSEIKISSAGKITIPKGYIGSFKVTVKNGDTSKTVTFKVTPNKVKTVKAAKKSATKIKVTWKKSAEKISGYQVQYSTKSTFTNATTKTVKGVKSTSKTLTSLKKGKTYYVRVRTYKTVNGKKVYSTWTNKKKVAL